MSRKKVVKKVSVISAILFIVQLVFNPIANVVHGSELSEDNIFYQDDTSIVYFMEGSNNLRVVENGVTEYIVYKENAVEILDENGNLKSSTPYVTENNEIAPFALDIDYRGCRYGSTRIDNATTTGIITSLAAIFGGPITQKATTVVLAIKTYVEAGKEDFYYKECATQYLPDTGLPYCLVTLTMYSDSRRANSIGYQTEEFYGGCATIGM